MKKRTFTALLLAAAMKKNLYSLILSDDVINEVDILAHQAGTSRSNMAQGTGVT